MSKTNSKPGTQKFEMRTNVRFLSILMQLGLHGKNPKAQAFMLVGNPGTGKTEGLKAIAKEVENQLGKKYTAEVWSAPQIQAEDLAGLPFPDKETMTTRLLPLRVGKSILEDKNNPDNWGLVAFDEAGSISPAQEAALLNFVHGGKLGELELPESIARGCMMNPEEVASNGRNLSPPAANRFSWLEWEPDFNSWYDYMTKDKGFETNVEVLPKDWESTHFHYAKSLIAQYLKRNQGSLFKMPEAHNASCPWASPRSWTNAARCLASVLAIKEKSTSDLAFLSTYSCVGEEARSFVRWLTEMDLPDPEELLANPKEGKKLLDKVAAKNRMDQLTVVLESLAAAAIQDSKSRSKKFQDRWTTACELIFPIFTEKNDVGLPAAHTLVQVLSDVDPKNFPKEAQKIQEIMKKSGIIPGVRS